MDELTRTAVARRSARLVVALLCAAVVALAARGLAHVNHDDALWSLAGWSAPFDLGVFLDAGDDILDGRNPYPAPGTPLPGPPFSPYVYPPLFAQAIVPLAVLPVTVAATLFSLLSLGCIVGALLLFGVRDWRCHLIAIVNPFTRQAIEYGAVGPILLLLVAVCWRYRDRATVSAAAVAGAVVVKLFLWPYALWLAFTSRLRAAWLAVSMALAAAFVSWAVIGFDGLADYPGLLRRFVKSEAEGSNSAFATLRALGLPSGLANTVALAIGAGLLVLAARAARQDQLSVEDRDRRSFILTLAAALVLTPIVRVHYLVLLIAPIALARPRLSPLWLAPLAAWPFWISGAYRGWANGELDDLLSAAAIALVVFAGSLVAGHPATRRAEPRQYPA